MAISARGIRPAARSRWWRVGIRYSRMMLWIISRWNGWSVPLGEPALVEDGGDLAVGVVVEQFVDGVDDRCGGAALFGGGQRGRQGQAVVLSTAEAHVRGDGVAGAGHGDVGE